MAAAPERPWNDADSLVQRLSAGLDSFEWKDADGICVELRERLERTLAPFPSTQARQILGKLRKKRQFINMILTGDAFIRCGVSDAQIRRQ